MTVGHACPDVPSGRSVIPYPTLSIYPTPVGNPQSPRHKCPVTAPLGKGAFSERRKCRFLRSLCECRCAARAADDRPYGRCGICFAGKGIGQRGNGSSGRRPLQIGWSLCSNYTIPQPPAATAPFTKGSLFFCPRNVLSYFCHFFVFFLLFILYIATEKW